MDAIVDTWYVFAAVCLTREKYYVDGEYLQHINSHAVVKEDNARRSKTTHHPLTLSLNPINTVLLCRSPYSPPPLSSSVAAAAFARRFIAAGINGGMRVVCRSKYDTPYIVRGGDRTKLNTLLWCGHLDFEQDQTYFRRLSQVHTAG